MAAHRISDAVIRRLPGYYRYLRELEKVGITRISSQELGARMGLTASQIRQDINCFGTLGQQGYGYNVAELRAHIGGILGLGRKYEMVIAGAAHRAGCGLVPRLFPARVFAGGHVRRQARPHRPGDPGRTGLQRHGAARLFGGTPGGHRRHRHARARGAAGRPSR